MWKISYTGTIHISYSLTFSVEFLFEFPEFLLSLLCIRVAEDFQQPFAQFHSVCDVRRETAGLVYKIKQIANL